MHVCPYMRVHYRPEVIVLSFLLSLSVPTCQQVLGISLFSTQLSYLQPAVGITDTLSHMQFSCVLSSELRSSC